ncbi:hypothetical protein [Saccharopolyspora spinosa]|uniref:Uncharacterized protein n=1 Tax=Saccharopolyspora spinosa TaxID=60894 RepID=A0A2N3XT84_SACSN|nr:hypothetical protein A8926_1395 [Saccharopolyspora spinosa]
MISAPAAVSFSGVQTGCSVRGKLVGDVLLGGGWLGVLRLAEGSADGVPLGVGKVGLLLGGLHRGIPRKLRQHLVHPPTTRRCAGDRAM